MGFVVINLLEKYFFRFRVLCLVLMSLLSSPVFSAENKISIDVRDQEMLRIDGEINELEIKRAQIMQKRFLLKAILLDKYPNQDPGRHPMEQELSMQEVAKYKNQHLKLYAAVAADAALVGTAFVFKRKMNYAASAIWTLAFGASVVQIVDSLTKMSNSLYIEKLEQMEAEQLLELDQMFTKEQIKIQQRLEALELEAFELLKN